MVFDGTDTTALPPLALFSADLPFLPLAFAADRVAEALAGVAAEDFLRRWEALAEM